MDSSNNNQTSNSMNGYLQTQKAKIQNTSSNYNHIGYHMLNTIKRKNEILNEQSLNLDNSNSPNK